MIALDASASHRHLSRNHREGVTKENFKWPEDAVHLECTLHQVVQDLELKFKREHFSQRELGCGASRCRDDRYRKWSDMGFVAI